MVDIPTLLGYSGVLLILVAVVAALVRSTAQRSLWPPRMAWLVLPSLVWLVLVFNDSLCRGNSAGVGSLPIVAVLPEPLGATSPRPWP